MNRVFKAKFTYKLRAIGSVLDGRHRQSSVQTLAPSMKKALPKLEHAARRQCRYVGDEIFVRIDRVTDRGEVSS